MSFAIKLSTFCSVFYYVMTDPHHYLLQTLSAVGADAAYAGCGLPVQDRDTARFLVVCVVILCSSVRTHGVALVLGHAMANAEAGKSAPVKTSRGRSRSRPTKKRQ